MPKYITIGVNRSDGTMAVIKQPSVVPSAQRDYVCGIQSYDPTYSAMYIFDLDRCVKRAFFASELACTVTAANKSVVYGSNKPSFTATYSPTPTAGDYSGSLAYTCAYSKGEDVGTYPITPSGLTSDKYGFVYVAGTLTVTKKALSVTAVNKSITVGDNAPEYSVEYDGFITGENAEDLSGELVYTIKNANNETVADITAAVAGTYKIIPSGLTSTNYEIEFVEGTLTIS